MPLAIKAFPGLNTLMFHSPEQAIIAAGGLLAVTGTLTLRHVLTATGLDKDLSPEQELELDLLDEQAPDGFVREGVALAHGSLIENKMRNTRARTKFWWRHAPWDLRRNGPTLTADPMLDPSAKMIDYIHVATPVLNAEGKLV